MMICEHLFDVVEIELAMTQKPAETLAELSIKD